MTAVCGGGASAGKPGFAEQLYVAPAMIGALLNNIPTPWAVPLAGFIGAMTFRLSTFCTTDPPAVPTFTAADILSLTNPFDPVAYGNATEKFQQLIGAYMWYQVCQCTSVATPDPPAPPTAPTDVDTGPVVAPPISTAACFDITRTLQTADMPANGPSPSTQWEITQEYLSTPGPDLQLHSPTTSFRASHSFALPAGATRLQVSTTHISGDASNGTELTCYFLNSAGAGVAGTLEFSVGTTGQHFEGTIGAIPSTAVYCIMEWHTASSVAQTAEFRVRMYCSSGTSDVQQPCCPPDDLLQSQLTAIFQLVQLIQRQAAPFAYITGDSHDISGSGELEVSGLLGIKIQLNTWGGGVGTELADPDEWFEAGWFAWGGPDGFATRERITHSPHVSLPVAAGQFTRIGYTLGAGVTATATELVREA